MYNTFLMSTCCELLCNAIWPIIWGIFLFDPFGMKSEPSYDCYANWDDNYATAGVMDIDDSYWTNVSLRFRVIMWIGFVGSLCVTLILMPTKFFYGREYFMQQGPVSLNWREQIATGHQCMSNLAALLFVALAILIFIFRGSHTGFVCSGWYLSSHESMNENIRSVYDVDVGMFLFVLLILNSVMLACMGCACLATCCALTTYQMNRQAFMNPQFNVNMTPDQMNQY